MRCTSLLNPHMLHICCILGFWMFQRVMMLRPCCDISKVFDCVPDRWCGMYCWLSYRTYELLFNGLMRRVVELYQRTVNLIAVGRFYNSRGTICGVQVCWIHICCTFVVFVISDTSAINYDDCVPDRWGGMYCWLSHVRVVFRWSHASSSLAISAHRKLDSREAFL